MHDYEIIFVFATIITLMMCIVYWRYNNKYNYSQYIKIIKLVNI